MNDVTEFRIGTALGQSLEVLRKHPLFILGTLAAIYLLPFLILAPILGLKPEALAQLNKAPNPAAIAGLIIFGIFILALIYASAAIITLATDDALHGRPVNLSGTVGKSVAALPRLFVNLLLLILFFFLITFAMATVIVGVIGAGVATSRTGGSTMAIFGLGVIAYLFFLLAYAYLGARFGFAFHAICLDGAGPWEAFGRSSRLSLGHRWKIVALYVVIIIISVATSLLVNYLRYGAIAPTSPEAIAEAMSMTSPIFWVQQLINFLLVAWLIVLFASIYIGLRREKDGDSQADVAQVFA